MVRMYVKVDSFVDLITNSSSELFVGTSKTHETLQEMIEDIHPDYLNEYEPLKKIDDLTDDELMTYLVFHYDRWSNYHQCRIQEVVDGFDKEDMYEKRHGYYFIRNDFVKDYREQIIKSIDPDRKLFFLFSIDDNPNWEMQEQLMSIMSRYHLG